LRTPEENFLQLPGYPFAPHYVDDLAGYEGLRLHYLDEGAGASVMLFLHGEPTWSYLYRRMLPIAVRHGYRAVAPDFFGFGRSDKPREDAVYTFDFHRGAVSRLIERLDLNDVTLVCQDWGGLIGLTLPLDWPQRFSGLIVMNTMFATGDAALPPGFLAWRDWVRRNPDLDPGRLLKRGCPHLTSEEANAYSAPFPSNDYKAGVRRFPDLVPDRLDAPGAELSRAAREWWGQVWRGRTHMAIGLADPVLGAEPMAQLRRSIRGCPAPQELPEAGHFVQEWGAQVMDAAFEAWARG
jgi:pimeloyl-ACP methyl ester carboxylesterase